MKLKSYAKINLFLNITKKRLDNYHSLKTVFERISLSDDIYINPREDRLLKVSCDNNLVPTGDRNLCFKAAKLLKDEFRLSCGLDIKIKKRIPVGAGLGGGSSNAATVLLGLNRLWQLGLSKAKLAKLAGKIGSDVPFFIYEAPFAEGSGRGDRIKPLNMLKDVSLQHILVVPKIHVSTPLIYAEFDRFAGLKAHILSNKKQNKLEVVGLTKPPCNVKLLTSELVEKKLKPGLLFNSLECVTIRLYPEVKRIKNLLLRLGLKHILMSGSGPAVFAVLPSLKNALRFAKVVKSEKRSWQVFVVKTV